MQKQLAEIYDLRRYRDSLVKKIKHFVPHFETHEISFTQLNETEIQYLQNLDKMRTAAIKYATGKLKTENPTHIASVKKFLKMEMLDLKIRNERVALIDEITRSHSMLNNMTTETYPEARFVYPNALNSYTPYINVLCNETI